MTRRQLFASLTALVFLVNLARVVYAPLVEPLRAALTVGPGAIGVVVTLVWVGSALPRIPTGYLLTRLPRHRVVLLAGGVLALAAAFAARADGIVQLGAGALLMGLASGAYFVSANPLVSELYPDRVGRALGIHGTAAQLAAVAAAPLVGLALTVATWRSVFDAIALAAAAATAVLVLVSRRTELPAASGVDRDLLGAVRSQWRLVATGVLVLGTTGFVWQGVFNFYVSHLIATGLATSTARQLLTLLFLAGVPAFAISGRLADRLPHVPYLLVHVAAFVGGVLAVTLVRGLLPLAVATVAVGYVIHGLFPAVDAYLLGTLSDEHRGGAYAVYSGTMMLTQAAGSTLVGALADAGIGYGRSFQGLAVGLAGVLVVLVLLWAGGRLPGGDNS